MTLVPGCCGRREIPGHTLTCAQQAVLDTADVYLRRGLDLKRWWDTARATDSFAQKFPLSVSFNRPDESYGFFDVALVDGREMRIMGNYQCMFYDQPKTPGTDKARAGRWMRDQLRQFVLHYFMRVSSFRLPEAFIPLADRQPVPPWLAPLSWCPEENPEEIGFGFSQYFYRERGGGRIGAFPESERSAIVDLREIGPRFDWILPHVRIFDFKLTVQPFGPGTPTLVLPLDEGSYLVVSPEFVIDEEEPAPGLLGRYGFGYAFIKNPEQSLLAYGPGEFDAAFEIIQFAVDTAGRIQAEAIFVVNRPTRIANVSLNPLDWAYQAASLMTLGTSRFFLEPFKQAAGLLPGSGLSFDPVTLYVAGANLLTAGQARRDFCVSLEQLEREFLILHFQQHYQTLVGSLQTWRQIPDWLAPEDELPAWVVTGRSGR
jgi:hypothetical protein